MLLKQVVQPMAAYGQGLGGSSGLLDALKMMGKNKKTPDEYTQNVDLQNEIYNQQEGISFDEPTFADRFNEMVGDSGAFFNSFGQQPQQSTIPVQPMQNQYNPYGQQAYANLGFGNSMPQREYMYRY